MSRNNRLLNPLDLSWMTGCSVSVSFAEPISWFFTLGDRCAISAECPWRLIHRGQIAVSSDDHKQQFGLPAPIDAASKATTLLAGAAITLVEVRQGTADLVLTFGNELRLEILPFSSGYESWQVSTPEGRSVIACGGGKLQAL
jgi:Family of unknown function (DUF6188)